ncbi:unnamed protein product [Didymodactylos carnosus]|uniref:Phosphatidic acid phosphatase type 2/haloperoxidase domain-containing protein n=1 Tax=Didymodactylos carnosus TaxID=1234261 RepID=A0A814W2N7_9BILA|nr:unnamed protein product [Didymodactylos carnosus]CAF1195946.1 unnamed protein product [Didymodactylos carnosus]CAF3828215.1 unnamed protein product [Didymodactylos carnosus]CAF3960349.1 unnamed protein product [Didymodactylos carnosus]
MTELKSRTRLPEKYKKLDSDMDDNEVYLTNDAKRHLAHVERHSNRMKPISAIKILFDIALSWLLLKYLIKPVRRGFLCSNLNLYHPQPVQKVIPTWLLFVLAVILPIFVVRIVRLFILLFIIGSEFVRWYYIIRTKAARVVYRIKFRKTTYNIPEWVGNLYIIIGVFIFAACANSFLTNVGKVSAGRLRPHFIPSCFHTNNYTLYCRTPNDWITNYTCVGESSDIIKEKDGANDIRQSFPSGHASTAFCGLIFLALYIYKVWCWRNIGMFPCVAQVGCAALAAYIGITRVTDHRHHPTDVLGGSILGTVVAIIAFRYMVGQFKYSTLEQGEIISRADESDIQK